MNLAAESTATALLSLRRRLSSSAKIFFSSSYLRSMNSTRQFSPSMSTSAIPLEPKLEKSKPKPQPWLIVGLGNPGKRFNGTRHNVGFEMVDTIAEAEGISMSSVSFKSLFGKGFIGDAPVILAKPQTFMNLSGWRNCFILQDSAEASSCDF